MQKTESARHLYRFSLAIAAVLLIALIPSCSAEKTVISSVTSPDSNNEVQIVCVDNAGPGQNATSIVVQFKNKHADKFKDVSIFNGNGVIQPTAHVVWKNNNTLLVTFSNASIGFQAVRIGSVSIEYGERSQPKRLSKRFE